MPLRMLSIIQQPGNGIGKFRADAQQIRVKRPEDRSCRFNGNVIPGILKPITQLWQFILQIRLTTGDYHMPGRVPGGDFHDFV